jgi:hypothetical protein
MPKRNLAGRGIGIVMTRPSFIGEHDQNMFAVLEERNDEWRRTGSGAMPGSGVTSWFSFNAALSVVQLPLDFSMDSIGVQRGKQFSEPEIQLKEQDHFSRR